MKSIKKWIASALAVGLISAALASFTGCGGGISVSFALPEGYTGNVPAAVKAEEYGQVTLPDLSDVKVEPYLRFAGWEDATGKLYSAGSTFNIGSDSVTLTAAFQGYELITANCENPGTISMSQGRFIGPTPANTIFYSDGTWTADAYGGAIEGHFKGTYSITSTGDLDMILVEQDGIVKNEKVAITKTDRTFDFTLAHPGDSANSMKYHKNHVSMYTLIDGWNKSHNTSIPLPEVPYFTISFRGVASKFMFGMFIPNPQDTVGEMAPVTLRDGEAFVLPQPAYTREGYKFKYWQILDGQVFQSDGNVNHMNPGETYIMTSADIYIEGVWEAI